MSKGLNPKVNESQNKSWETLASRLSVKPSRPSKKSLTVEDEEEDDDDAIEVDIFASKHCILHESKISKRSDFHIFIIN